MNFGIKVTRVQLNSHFHLKLDLRQYITGVTGTEINTTAEAVRKVHYIIKLVLFWIITSLKLTITLKLNGGLLYIDPT